MGASLNAAEAVPNAAVPLPLHTGDAEPLKDALLESLIHARPVLLVLPLFEGVAPLLALFQLPLRTALRVTVCEERPEGVAK